MNLQLIELGVFCIFCVISSIQIFYYLYFFARLAFYKAAPTTEQQTHPVSVIICARDEAANLAKNLRGALLQQYPTTHEVVVVNDNSYDDTKFLLEDFEAEYKHLRVVELKQEAKMIPGKKFPLSIGIKGAKHEIVLLTDADCVPATEHWISEMQNSYTNTTEIVLGYGAYHKAKGFLNKLIRWEAYHSALQYLSYALAGQPYMGVGRNLSYRKGLFYKLKGFSAHNHIASGDDDLFVNMGATKTNVAININPAAFTLSKPATNWATFFKQKNRHYSTAKYYKPLHKFLLSTYALTQFLYYPAFVAALILFDWRMVLGVYALRFIVHAIVHYRAMAKLKEQDLRAYFLFFDIGLLFYYLFFAFSLFKKPPQHWK
jgi:glycosyltransferase involved in cell wall biosynthesis